MSSPIPSFKLNDGNEIPSLGYGLGTANFKRKNAPPFDQTIVNNTLTALSVGYHHLDGAEAYGNEAELGAAIAQSSLPRSSLFVTTKTSCREGETISQAFHRSLEKLGLSHVDLYLIHSPYFSGATPETLREKWSELEKLKDAGLAKSIGVSNFLKEHLEAIIEQNPSLKYKPAINQIEYHPYLQHITEKEGDLVEYHKKHGIVVEAYAPLTAITKAQGGPVDPVYEELAEKYGVTTGEIALRWCLDQGIVAVTTSSSKERLEGWLKRVGTFKLTEDEVKRISAEGRKKNYRGFWNNKLGEDDWR
ncbi:alpha-keto ester reductase [Naviculisporaceae sp. PSN 640]